MQIVPKLIKTSSNKDHYNENRVELDPYARLHRDLLSPEGMVKTLFDDILPLYFKDSELQITYKSFVVSPSPLDVDECKLYNITYSQNIKVNLDVHYKGQINTIQVPLMQLPQVTKIGSFIINGCERVMVFHLKKASGVFFYHNYNESSTSSVNSTCRLITDKNQWFVTLIAKSIYLFIKRDIKLSLVLVLRALEYSTHEVLSNFAHSVKLIYRDGRLNIVNPDVLIGKSLPFSLADSNNALLVQSYVAFTKSHTSVLGNACWMQHSDDFLIQQANAKVTLFREQQLIDGNTYDVFVPDESNLLALLHDDVLMYQHHDHTAALIHLCSMVTESTSPESIDRVYRSLLRIPNTINPCVRDIINNTLGLQSNSEFVEGEDLIAMVKLTVSRYRNRVPSDHDDSLVNRTVGHFASTVPKIVSLPLKKLIKNVKAAIEALEEDQADYIGRVCKQINKIFSKHNSITSALNDNLSTNPHFQLLEELNPLSSLTHRRKITCLSSTGGSNEKLSFASRSITASHYGRICVNETPEGQNIGLVNSMSYSSRIHNDFLDAAYYPVKDGQIINERVYLSSKQEKDKNLLPYVYKDHRGPNNTLDSDRKYKVFRNGIIAVCSRDEVDYMNWSPNHIFSLSSSLIPFVEHDDVNRVLMASNMQRQAVTLSNEEYPLISTGFEEVVAHGCKLCVTTSRAGQVVSANSQKVVVYNNTGDDVLSFYHMPRCYVSNKYRPIEKKVVVKSGQTVESGSILAESSSITQKKLALGQNVLVAYMSHYGNNFEDSVVISRRIVEQGKFHSSFCKELVCRARVTKIGNEEITRDIPTVSCDRLVELDEDGIIRLGSIAKPGDILVGKVTPQVRDKPSPEEKLLVAIFGEKSFNVRDTSLRVPHDLYVRVINVQVHNAEQTYLDKINKLEDYLVAIRELLQTKLWRKKLINNTTIKSVDLDRSLDEILKFKMLSRPNQHLLTRAVVQVNNIKNKIAALKKSKAILCNKLSLPHDVEKQVVVTIAGYSSLQAGDKIAGRHGNKGVISSVLPVEDMPYLADGQPIDIILTPIGVPSRMNIGQIMELILGYISWSMGKIIEDLISQPHTMTELRDTLHYLYNDLGLCNYDFSHYSDSDLTIMAKQLCKGVPIEVEVFNDGKGRTYIVDTLRKMNLQDSQVLYDGRTGLPLEEKVSVGVAYIMKLDHLIENKIHTRATGPYNIITQQPLGGRNYKGGQRVGEMEVLALQSYGAAHLLQEMMTVKSDDMEGRDLLYKNILKGYVPLNAKVPEVFYTLTYLLNGLGLNFDLVNHNNSHKKKK